MNEIAKVSTPTAPANPMMPRSMDQAIRLAELMCQGKMVPAHLQNSPGDCLMVIEQAMRWDMSPFAVAQCTSSIKGKLMFEGKLVAAAIESSGAIVGLIDYKFKGEGLDRSVTVTAMRRGETEPRVVDVCLKDVKTDNGMWSKQPDQQLVYSGVRVWGRRWTPGVMLGVYTPEEFPEVPRQQFDGTTIDAVSERVTSTAPNADSAKSKADPAPTPKTIETVDALINKIASCEDPEEWLASDTKTQVYRDKLKRHPDLSRQLEGAFEAARIRLFPDPDPMEDATDLDVDPETGEILPPEKDADREFALDLIHQFQDAKTIRDLAALPKNAAVAAWGKRIKGERPELDTMVADAYAQRETDFTPLAV